METHKRDDLIYKSIRSKATLLAFEKILKAYDKENQFRIRIDLPNKKIDDINSCNDIEELETLFDNEGFYISMSASSYTNYNYNVSYNNNDGRPYIAYSLCSPNEDEVIVINEKINKIINEIGSEPQTNTDNNINNPKPQKTKNTTPKLLNKAEIKPVRKHYSYSFSCGSCRLYKKDLQTLNILITKDYSENKSNGDIKIIAEPSKKHLKLYPDEKKLYFHSLDDFINNPDIINNSNIYDFTIEYRNEGCLMEIKLPRNRNIFDDYSKNVIISGSNETYCLGKFHILKDFISKRTGFLDRITLPVNNSLGFFMLFVIELHFIGLYLSGSITNSNFKYFCMALIVFLTLLIFGIFISWCMPKTILSINKTQKWYTNQTIISWITIIAGVLATFLSPLLPFVFKK